MGLGTKVGRRSLTLQEVRLFAAFTIACDHIRNWVRLRVEQTSLKRHVDLEVSLWLYVFSRRIRLDHSRPGQ